MALGERKDGPVRDHVWIEGHHNRRQRFKQRARAEYVAGAKNEWRKRTGRPMTSEELDRVLRQYPGDI